MLRLSLPVPMALWLSVSSLVTAGCEQALPSAGQVEDGAGGTDGTAGDAAADVAADLAAAPDAQADIVAATDAAPDLTSDAGASCESGCLAEPDLIALPAGSFTLGSTTASVMCNATPVHPVTLSAFSIDRTEVTVAQYAAFYAQLPASQKCNDVNSSGFLCGQPDQKTGCTWPLKAGKEDYPVNCVDWFQANAYCGWAHKGGRLPTEAQFEYAARNGGAPQSYPWGEASPDCATNAIYANSLKDNGGCGKGGPWPVCSRPGGNSAQGACDLIGNVSEWTWDWYVAYTAAAQTDPSGPASAPPASLGLGPAHAVRGSDFSGNASTLNSSCRIAPVMPARSKFVGFRCARAD